MHPKGTSYYDDLKEVVLDEVLYELDTPKLDMDKTPKNKLIDNISAVYKMVQRLAAKIN